MALSAGTVWEIRRTGSDANGGLYYSSQPAADTDYSQQDSPQLSVTDGVANGTTTITSATGGFTAHMIGNGINIAGTCYMIATFNSTNSITVDRAITTATGLTMKVGGALATPGFCASQAGTCDQIWMKAGTYTLSSASNNVAGGRVTSPGGTAGFPCKWEGYGSSRGDKGTKPVIDDGGLGGGGINVFTLGTNYTIVDNITVSGSNANNVAWNLNAVSCRLIRCKSSGAAAGFYVPANYSALLFCEGANTGLPFDVRGICYLTGCVAHGSSTDGFSVTGSNTVVFDACISFGNGGKGFNSGGALQVAYRNCTSYGNTSDGFLLSSSGAAVGYHALNCLSVGNGGYGFNSASASGFAELLNCATYNNTSGATHFLTNSEGAITLSGNPFVSVSTNFGLNATAGAGAACRAAGLPSAFPGLAATVSYPDIGAVQHQDSGGGSNSRAVGPIMAAIQYGL